LYSKTGKHGHRKCHFYGTHIFTNKKIEDINTSNHHVSVPVVDKKEYLLLDIQEEDQFCTLFSDETERTREDLKLPKDNHLENMVEIIVEEFEKEEDNIYVQTLVAMG
jgi:translation initiation factor 5A